MKRKRIAGVCITLAAVVLAGTFAVSGNNTKDKNHVEIINVSYDPTREFYEAYNKIFSKYWKEETGQSVDVIQSHGRFRKAGSCDFQWTSCRCGDTCTGI